MSYLAIDIETIPPDPNENPVAWMDAQDKAKRSRTNKDAAYYLAVNPDVLNICCIVMYDSEAADSDNQWIEKFAVERSDERDMIYDTWLLIDHAVREGKQLLSFNGKSFDLPALHRRAMLYDMAVNPLTAHRVIGKRCPDKYHLDLMQTLALPSAFGNGPEYHNFDYYLHLFGVGQKVEGYDGSKVWPSYQEKDVETIQAYCRQDVEMLVALYERVSPWLLEYEA